jgi:penicillin-binding protein 2
MNKSAATSFDIKISLYGLIMILACCILVGRLFHLQIRQGSAFATQSKRNFTRYEQTLSLRGNILDCSGTILATNRPVTDLYWQGSGAKRLTLEHLAQLAQLATILGIPSFENYEELNKVERQAKKIPLATDISFEQLSKIIELFPEGTNIKLVTHFKRFYPYQSLASHILGYLAYIDKSGEGKTGIEKLFEETLRGKDGSIMRIINSIGTYLAEYELEKTLQGQHIVTTLDLPLQKLAEEVFPPGISGCFILMDPATGALKVCLSRPTFDPNIFTAPISCETWNALQEHKPFLNRICAASYPIGSTFKLITVSAALETGLIEQHSAWNCLGYSSFAGRKYHCVRKEGHGLLTTKLAMAHSCNIPFFEIGKKIDMDLITHYANLFGLGRATGSIFPEATGLVPSRAWKRKVKHERWWTGETLSAMIGQTFLLATPLQIARMVASIETGFLVTPRIMETTPIVCEPLAIKLETRRFLQKSMHASVTKGTARWLDRLHNKDFIIHAKTSTAQTSSLEKLKDGAEFLEHSWLASNFTYKNYPPLTLVIITEKTGRTGIPPRIAYNFLKGYKTLMDTKKPDPVPLLTESEPGEEIVLQESFIHD